MSEALRWKQRGTVYLWRYREHVRDFPGWHMTADAEGCASLLELLDAFKRARWSCDALVHLTPPTDEILSLANQWVREARRHAQQRLRLKYPKEKVAEDFWSLTADGCEAALLIGRSRMDEFYSGIGSILEGEGV